MCPASCMCEKVWQICNRIFTQLDLQLLELLNSGDWWWENWNVFAWQACNQGMCTTFSFLASLTGLCYSSLPINDFAGCRYLRSGYPKYYLRSTEPLFLFPHKREKINSATFYQLLCSFTGTTQLRNTCIINPVILWKLKSLLCTEATTMNQDLCSIVEKNGTKVQ